MKIMRHIVFLINDNGDRIDFERFSTRSVKTIKENIEELWSSPLYRVCNKGATKAIIYATPDGYNHEKEPVDIIELTA